MEYGLCKGKLHTREEAYTLAHNQGEFFCNRSLRDLNYMPNSCRLNRHNFEYTSDPFYISIWPIFANFQTDNNKNKSMMIGYWYEKSNKFYIDLDISVPMTAKKKLLILSIIASILTVFVLAAPLFGISRGFAIFGIAVIGALVLGLSVLFKRLRK